MRALLAAARCGAADPELVLATASRVDFADADSWLREWTAAGGAAWAAAQAAPRAEAFQHAASYYGAALALIDASDGTVQEAALWRRQRDCWDRAVGGLDGMKVAIPYEATTLPGYFFSAGRGRRPLLAVDPGGRMVTSQAWVQVGAAARDRGCHVLIFDGPGRQGARWLGGLVLRPDWAAVVSPVADWLLTRDDVDRGQMAIIGLEFGALGVAQALCAERRFAAAALVPGIIDGATPWLAELPGRAQAALCESDPDVFERELHLASLFDPGIVARLRRSTRCFDREGLPLYDLYQWIRGFRLGEQLQRIVTPTAVWGPGGAGPWSGQASELVRTMPAVMRLMSAGRHEDAITSWLDELGETQPSAAVS
jgi:hypothetical protein